VATQQQPPSTQATEAAEGADGPVEVQPAPEGGPVGEEAAEVEQPEWLKRSPELETAQAIAERQKTQLAYTDLTPAEEEGLLKQAFATQLQAIATDPSRLLEDAEFDQVISPTEAVVTVEGEKALVDSSVPLRATDAEGKLSKVDLSLDQTQQGYVPSNPLVGVELPLSAAGEIEVGSKGVALNLQGAAPKAEASPTDTGGVFAPEAGEDTSLLLTPISAGLEISAMLASRRSPEQLVFSVSLPAGDQLRAAPDGGVEVLDPKGEVAYRITAPQAVDAQGTALPVTMVVKGDSLVLALAHREMDIAYPILIDPEVIEEGWSNLMGAGKWTWEWSGVPSSETYIGKTSCIVTCWGTGLYVRSRSETTYPAGSFGRWKLNAPGSTTYFRSAAIGPLHLDAHGCTANQPHGYFGLWRASDNGWSVLGEAYPSGMTTEINTGGTPLSSATHTFFLGLNAASASNIKCGRDYALTGATFYFSDPENPTVSTPSGVPSGWIKHESPFTITVPVSDPGLGVKSAKITSEAGESTQTLSCTGNLSSTCPASNNFQFNVSSASFKEGERNISFSAKDALEKFSNTKEATLKVDRTKPGVVLDGQLAEVTEEEGGEKAEEEDETAFDPLHLPVYNLEIKATDGSTENATTKRSGVKRIEVFLDNAKTPAKTWTQPGEPGSCDNCALTETYTLKLNELGADTHHMLRILATDFAGNEPREREIGFEYVPATGEKDEYVMQQFPLFDPEAEAEEGVEASGPELAVNLMNGNLVFHQKDVEVPGSAADLEVERFYNSLLPEDQNTEWGDGWTLAQTPELELEEPKSGPPTEATLVEESGAVESAVELPTKTGEERFDPALQTTIAREPGGYALTDETGESAGTVQFNASGQASELETGEFSGVEYDYADGELSEIAVEDPASAGGSLEEAAEREALEDITPKFVSAFGSAGSGNGQFNVLNDVVTDPTDGSLWASDDDNDRVQHFSSSGEYLGKFSVCSNPAAVAVEGQGNVYVACGVGINKYSDTGSLLKTIATRGYGKEQVAFATGLALDSEEGLWVASEESGEVKHFNASGSFVGSFSTGSILDRPWGIAVSPAGEIYVTQPYYDHRVAVFDEEGNLLRTFGSQGAGQGQLAFPSDVAVDTHGYVWVADSRNDRVEVFNEAGEYVTSFGEKGSGEGQLNDDWWIRLALDAKGNVWVTDEGNHRIERWRAPGITLNEPGVPMQDDPKLEVDISEGLVESVEGKEAGTVDYEHDGELLTAVNGPEGEADYEYDEAGRMTKVELAGGSWAEIAYEATYGRVKSVTVSIEGSTPKTTKFEYTDSPSRSTRVVPDGEAATVYDIAADGSFVRWQNAVKPPELEDIGGTLYDPEHRETAKPIEPGVYSLEIKAHSDEGIAKIEVVANGNLQVDEKTCDEETEKCETVSDQWVTEAGNWSPGILYLEVLATDRLGAEASQRFWVNIPYTPPPDPEVEAPPTYIAIKEFREEFGLDLDLKGDEEAINDRIFASMSAWNNPHTPAGEVARATSERWGVPLRQVDAAELEYRERYLAQATSVIPAWAASNAPGAYAGFYIDHRAGGIIRVGFTTNQASTVAQLKASAGLMAPDRIASFTYQPNRTLATLEGSLGTASQVVSTPPAPPGIASVGVDIPSNGVRLGTTEVASTEAFAAEAFGGGAGVVVVPESPSQEFEGRYKGASRSSPPLESGTLTMNAQQGSGRGVESVRSRTGNPCGTGMS
jgi:Domain of unknown function (DUF6531)/NHL repeat